MGLTCAPAQGRLIHRLTGWGGTLMWRPAGYGPEAGWLLAGKHWFFAMKLLILWRAKLSSFISSAYDVRHLSRLCLHNGCYHTMDQSKSVGIRLNGGINRQCFCWGASPRSHRQSRDANRRRVCGHFETPYSTGTQTYKSPAHNLRNSAELLQDSMGHCILNLQSLVTWNRPPTGT